MDYLPHIRELLAEDRLMPLGPGTPNLAVQGALAKLTAASAFAPHVVHDDAAARACLAGLWMWHDHLDASHTISQEVDTVEGSWWHGITHRREPDFANARYWFRRVRSHALFEPLARAARDLAVAADLKEQASSAWEPLAFVDSCERASRGDERLEMWCREVQRAEWRLLFEHCYRLAIGPTP